VARGAQRVFDYGLGFAAADDDADGRVFAFQPVLSV